MSSYIVYFGKGQGDGNAQLCASLIESYQLTLKRDSSSTCTSEVLLPGSNKPFEERISFSTLYRKSN